MRFTELSEQIKQRTGAKDVRVNLTVKAVTGVSAGTARSRTHFGRGRLLLSPRPKSPVALAMSRRDREHSEPRFVDAPARRSSLAYSTDACDRLTSLDPIRRHV
jgi:hypothetical protein